MQYVGSITDPVEFAVLCRCINQIDNLRSLYESKFARGIDPVLYSFSASTTSAGTSGYVLVRRQRYMRLLR